ncbi:MAG: SH3 domain-containing protein [Phormidesmis sp.]
MKNFLLGLSKFVLGIILAMLIMTLAGASMAHYFMTRMVDKPERPGYENDLPEEQRPTAQEPEDSESAEAVPAEAEAAAPEPAPEPESAVELSTADGYAVSVSQPVGLVLRSGPGTDYTAIGGLEYQQGVEVIAEEGGWLKVLLSSGEEGWIKDGNVTRE